MTGPWTRGMTRRDSLTRQLTRSSTIRTGTTVPGKPTRNSTEVSTVNLFTVRQWSSEKVMFSVVSICLHGGGSHLNVIPDALDLTVEGSRGLILSPPDTRPPLRHLTWDPCPSGHQSWHPLPLATSPASDIWWPSLDTCAKKFT